MYTAPVISTVVAIWVGVEIINNQKVFQTYADFDSKIERVPYHFLPLYTIVHVHTDNV